MELRWLRPGAAFAVPGISPEGALARFCHKKQEEKLIEKLRASAKSRKEDLSTKKEDHFKSQTLREHMTYIKVSQ
jgi:hypothetical protein